MAEKVLQGIGVSEGIRIGKAFKLVQDLNPETFGDITEDEVQPEVERFRIARENCAQRMDGLVEQAQKTLGAEKAVVLKGQKSFLSDPAFCPQMENLITKKFFSAEKAVEQVVNQFARVFEKMPNEYMRERAADIRDVGKQLLTVLTGIHAAKIEDIAEKVILFADDLAPSDTVKLKQGICFGICDQKGRKDFPYSDFCQILGDSCCCWHRKDYR